MPITNTCKLILPLACSDFFFLLITLLFPFIMAIKKKHAIFLLFIMLFSFNLLFESMLERQAGVVFYAFFNGLLFYYMNDNNSGDAKSKLN
ncbi:MAG: hypothetical protein R2764_20660 [Bacteroidales bacterium]